MINPIIVIHCIIDCVCLVHIRIIIKISAIFDLNNDEKKEPNISRASWLATIKVHFFRKFYYCSQKYSISLFFSDMLNAGEYIASFNGKNMLKCVYFNAYTFQDQIPYFVYSMVHIVFDLQHAAYNILVLNNVKDKYKSLDKVTHVHN